MLMSFTGYINNWMHRMTGSMSNGVDSLQPEHYTIGLVLCIGLGYVLLRGRN